MFEGKPRLIGAAPLTPFQQFLAAQKVFQAGLDTLKQKLSLPANDSAFSVIYGIIAVRAYQIRAAKIQRTTGWQERMCSIFSCHLVGFCSPHMYALFLAMCNEESGVGKPFRRLNPEKL